MLWSSAQSCAGRMIIHSCENLDPTKNQLYSVELPLPHTHIHTRPGCVCACWWSNWPRPCHHLCSSWRHHCVVSGHLRVRNLPGSGTPELIIPYHGYQYRRGEALQHGTRDIEDPAGVWAWWGCVGVVGVLVLWGVYGWGVCAWVGHTVYACSAVR